MSTMKRLLGNPLPYWFIGVASLLPGRVLADIGPKPPGWGQLMYCVHNPDALTCQYREIFPSIPSIATYLALTLLIELPIFYLLGFRNRLAVGMVILANLISLPSLHYVAAYLDGDGWFVFLEIMVVLFETLFLKLAIRQMPIARIFGVVAIANVISASIGFLIHHLLLQSDIYSIEQLYSIIFG